MKTLVAFFPIFCCSFVGHAQSERTQKEAYDSVFNKAISPTDASVSNEHDSLKLSLSQHIDSLQKLNLPTVQYTHLLDSIRNLDPIKNVKETETRLKTLERDLDQKVSNINSSARKTQKDVNDGIQLVNKSGMSIDLLDISGSNANIPNSDLLTEGRKLPDAGTTGQLPANLNLPDGNLKIPSNPIGALSQIKSNKEIANVQKEITEASGYSKDLKALSHGNLDSASHLTSVAEKKAVELANVNELQGKTAPFDQYKQMAGQAGDPQAMKQLARDQFKNQAGGHFAGKEKELQSTMQQLAKYKQKYTSLASTLNLPKRVPNAMHGRPLVERILPGLSTQVIMKDHFMIDLNPQMGYKFNPRLTAGAGWNERIGYSHYHITHAGRVYGPRAFGEFKLGKGFVGRGEVEVMNTYVPTLGQLGLNDNGSRQWMWGVFVGLKKDYNITKYLKGNILTMYNLVDHYYVSSPYPDRLNVRIGFELPLKKKGARLAIKPLQVLSGEYSITSLTTRIDGLQSLGKNQLTTRLLQYPSAKNALTLSKGITSKYKAGRQAYLGAKQYRFDYQKKLRLHEIRDKTGNVVATTKDFRDVTMADGTIYCFLRMSKTECDYVNRGKEVVRARKNEKGNDIDIIWANEAEQNEVLEMMCRIFLVRGR